MTIIKQNKLAGKLMRLTCLLAALLVASGSNTALAQSGEAAHQPWQKSKQINFFPFGAGQHAIEQVFYKVPAGKRLVIEFFTYDVVAENPWFRFRIATTAGGVRTLHTVVVSEDNTCTKQFRLYADPDSEVVVQALRSGISGGFFANLTMSGYLVDAVQ
jgi:hypothetical protein